MPSASGALFYAWSIGMLGVPPGLMLMGRRMFSKMCFSTIFKSRSCSPFSSLPWVLVIS